MSMNSDGGIRNKTFWLLGDTITIKITGAETRGQYSAWEIVAPSQSGPPPDYHKNLDEGHGAFRRDGIGPRGPRPLMITELQYEKWINTIVKMH
jgi:hypothetical protein